MARPRQRRRKCLCCRAWFIPDPRKRGQQQYCSKKQCRKASKTASQQRWLCKSENESYFRGPEHVVRVQRWRRDHPGYWRQTNTPVRAALQDLIDTQPIEAMGQTGDIDGALQDVMAVRSHRRVERSAAADQADPSGIPSGAQRVVQPLPAG
jgi:hypothetical protein